MSKITMVEYAQYEMTPEEKEVVIAMRFLWNARLQKAAIQQVKALALF
ncbi:MAG: hypothetical protein K8R40_01055 [Anaerolineaceae bacterium]|nr:hypothetical protein [Anaerolineaceae bacterium]